ncbi:hypothetical protein SDC9_165217 [bioreactor metagenome]|uniref:Uncharacterized protein n=1 Tax=bioreactor metagenome TaxID=1076179 RepID=A0A645FW11_9ZZZZ
MGGKFRLFPIVGAQKRVQRPVFLGLKGLDLPLPVVHHPGCHGLDPPCGKAPADFLPQKRAELIAHDTVQNAPGLLGIHQILVDVPGLANRLLHHLFGNLVKGHPAGLFIRQIQKLL